MIRNFTDWRMVAEYLMFFAFGAVSALLLTGQL